jgi:multidrug efflux pump subunit AcrA (membrane-fusion protein)
VQPTEEPPPRASETPPASEERRPTGSARVVRAPSPERDEFPATPEGGRSEAVKTRGGKVKSVEVADGDVVKRGQLLVTFESDGNEDEIATLRDRIQALEGADDDEAKRRLREAKTAPAAGKLTGFDVRAGQLLKSGEVIGRIGDGETPRRVRVTVDKPARARVGQSVTLVLRRGGEAAGTVVSVSGKKVVVQCEVAADEVASVRF